MTLPHLLSAFRILSAPILLFLAYWGSSTVFLALLIVALLSDALDGWLARRLGQVSQFGMQLDSWGDLALCASVPLSVWWLWPDLVRRESVFIAIVVVSYTVPTSVALLKYHRLPSYHTYVARCAASVMGPSAFILLLGGPAWPFHIAAFVTVIEAIEETAITVMLRSWTCNVTGIHHAFAIRRHQEQTTQELSASVFLAQPKE